MLKKISFRRQVAKGYSQSAYVTDSCEILLNYLTTEAKLGKHSHEFAQFGYCFEGKFLFNIEEEQFVCDQGKAYDISGNLEHGAVIVEDILALDFKYLTNAKFQSEPSVKFDVLNQKNVYENASIKVTCLLQDELPDKEQLFQAYQANYLLSLKEQSIILNHKEYQLEKNEIYSIQSENKDFLSMELKNQVNILLLQIKQ